MSEDRKYIGTPDANKNVLAMIDSGGGKYRDALRLLREELLDKVSRFVLRREKI